MRKKPKSFCVSKVFLNKKNDQLVITVPRLRLGLKGKRPKFVKLRRRDFVFK